MVWHLLRFEGSGLYTHVSLCADGGCTESTPAVATTLAAVPSGQSPPTATAISQSAVSVLWQPPAGPNGPNLRYELARRKIRQPLDCEYQTAVAADLYVFCLLSLPRFFPVLVLLLVFVHLFPSNLLWYGWGLGNGSVHVCVCACMHVCVCFASVCVSHWAPVGTSMILLFLRGNCKKPKTERNKWQLPKQENVFMPWFCLIHQWLRLRHLPCH